MTGDERCPDPGETGWDGSAYQARFDALAASGRDVHGEADFVAALGPRRVLDAGCGTGRVAIRLAETGIDVEGVDRDEAMLAEARRRAPHITWRQADLAAAELPPAAYDVVVMAGNVLLFVDPGTEGAVVANLAAALAPGGVLVAGFGLAPGGYDLAAYDAHCAAAGLELAERWGTWARDPLGPHPDYAVSVHRGGGSAEGGVVGSDS